MAKLILAHDLGTTGNKATLFDENGCLIASDFLVMKRISLILYQLNKIRKIIGKQ